MKFLLGIAFGAVGMWAYQGGKLQGMLGNAPEPVRQFASNMQHTATNMQQSASNMQASDIVTPSPAEVAGRPEQPLP
jgi:hypothetical protein